MEKSSKINYIIIGVCAILVIGFCAFLMINHKELSDAEKFKIEYEKYNNAVTDTGKNMPKVEIDENNPVVYKSGKEIVDILKTEDAVVYFGYAKEPLCRNIIEALLEAAEFTGLTKLYYVDIETMRDEYVFNSSIEPQKTKEGTNAYYEILEILDEKLDKYYVSDGADALYDTGEKRLFAPTVVSIVDGKIKGFYQTTLKGNYDPYQKIDDAEKERLYDVFVSIIEFVTNETCGETESEGC